MSGGKIELHIQGGSGTRPDDLIAIKRGVGTQELALAEALALKRALMSAGLIANVPMLFGDDTSSTGLGAKLIDHVRATSGATPRPDVHGIEIWDETEGPFVAIRFEGEGVVGANPDDFQARLTEALDRNLPGLPVGDRLGLAIEVYMAASTEASPRARFIDFVTVLEILAEQQARSPEAIALVDSALADLDERRERMSEAEVNSLRGSLARLKRASISQSVRDLAVELDSVAIDGFDGGDVGTFLARCYAVRSELVHEGTAPTKADMNRLAGGLFFLLRRLLTKRLEA